MGGSGLFVLRDQLALVAVIPLHAIFPDAVRKRDRRTKSGFVCKTVISSTSSN